MTPFTLPELQEIARRAFLDAPSRRDMGLSALDAAVKAVYENSPTHAQYDTVVVTFPQQGGAPDCHYVAKRTGNSVDNMVRYQTIDGPIYGSKESKA